MVWVRVGSRYELVRVRVGIRYELAWYELVRVRVDRHPLEWAHCSIRTITVRVVGDRHICCIIWLAFVIYC